MKKANDETMLSAYLDGELDSADMAETDMRIETDSEARKYVLESVRTTAFLRANLKNALHEKSPKRLLDTLNAGEIAISHKKPVLPNLLRVAAVLVLGLLGFGSGMLLERSTVVQFPAFINPLPEPYCEVVDRALEYNLSGTPQKWRAPGGTVDVTVTPVKTYRDKNGVYYREYQMEVASASERSHLNGLAYRKVKGEWETKALIILASENAT